MAIIESTPRRLVLGSGSTKLTFDKDVGKAFCNGNFCFGIETNPVRSEFSSVTLDKAVDRASGVRFLVTRTGAACTFPDDDKSEAEKNIAALRRFLALGS